MKRRKVRCYIGRATLGPVRNIAVYYTMSEGYNIQLFMCSHCGEVFVVDWENPLFEGKDAKSIAGNSACPTCGKALKVTIIKYPETFRYRDSEGHFVPPHLIPPDEESVVKEFYDVST